MNQTTETLPPEFENEGAVVPNHSDPPNRTEREFRAELSQKLRTPLNAIIGFAELVAMRPGLAAKDPDVQHILRAARDLLEIINRELADPDLPPAKSEPTPVPSLSFYVFFLLTDFLNF